MDSLDLEILSLIQNDARVAHASVGERLGLTAPAVHARIKRMERDGVIRGYLTSIDPLAVNQSLLAFVRVMNHAVGKDDQAFEGFVRQQPNILECHDVSGEDSYMLKVRTDSPESLRRLLSRIRVGAQKSLVLRYLCGGRASAGSRCLFIVEKVDKDSRENSKQGCRAAAVLLTNSRRFERHLQGLCRSLPSNYSTCRVNRTGA